ncbi:hypothetical protein [Paraliomyxa miuraensis]|uniref:hypothetical protein n=1 Tax=Paraliomyxa miuraensis TaxID=376150 RepID=UPI0022562FA0|nr:hypothetical protein [Paraliomyxa miuraensis]MCX4239656.1 hypothetical protein [Paraliomyxa miuraensis]
MSKTITIVALVITFAGCGPEIDDDPPGTLEYEDPFARYYRLERRVDIVAKDPMLARSGCGFLTDRAYDDLMNTIDALDPSVDYGVHPECSQTAPPADDWFYIEGFTHSPFLCAWYCCHPDLIRAATVYFVVGSNLFDQRPNIDGEPYVALEPDMPCPE